MTQNQLAYVFVGRAQVWYRRLSVQPPDREPFVFDTDHPTAVESQAPTKDQTLWIAPGGPVEGRGDRGAPVHHQRIEVCAVDRQPPNVEPLGVHCPVVCRSG